MANHLAVGRKRRKRRIGLIASGLAFGVLVALRPDEVVFWIFAGALCVVALCVGAAIAHRVTTPWRVGSLDSQRGVVRLWFRTMRVHVDASPAIYIVERVAPFAQSVAQRLAAPGAIIVARELIRLECLILPLRNYDATLVADYDTWFTLQVAEPVPFTAALFRRAAEIRARHNFKTPDALHLAAAVEGACDVFLTNDAQMTGFNDVTIEVV